MALHPNFLGRPMLSSIRPRAWANMEKRAKAGTVDYH